MKAHHGTKRGGKQHPLDHGHDAAKTHVTVNPKSEHSTKEKPHKTVSSGRDHGKDVDAKKHRGSSARVHPKRVHRKTNSSPTHRHGASNPA